MEAVKKKLENPLTSMLTTLVLVGGGLAAVGQIETYTDSYDNSHTSVDELAIATSIHPVSYEQFEELDKKIDAGDLQGRCRWLKSEMRALADSIYVRRRDGADQDYIHDLEGDLDGLKDEYKAFDCVRLLSK